METTLARRVHGPRLKPLAGCLAIALALGSSGALAAPSYRHPADRPALHAMLERSRELGDRTLPKRPDGFFSEQDLALTSMHTAPPGRAPAGGIPVTNCDDSGPGSLRDAIDNVAVSGDTIDLTNTGCSTITLTTGSIFIAQTDLTLQGPGMSGLEINGSYLYSLRHLGSGTLSVYDLTVMDGSKYLDAAYNIDASGGCIYSAGTLTIARSAVEFCYASTANASYTAKGGALYGRNGVILVDSVVGFARAGTDTLSGYGGGVYTPGTAIVAYSRMGFAAATGAVGGVLAGDGMVVKYSTIFLTQSTTAGAIYASGNAIIENSTIAQNQATVVGGVFLGGGPTTNSPFVIINSTITGNTAQVVGGVAIQGYPGRISNSTIAFNIEANASNTKYGAGLFANAPLELESSIVVRNTLTHSTYGPLPDDIGGGVTLTGANNIAQSVVPPTLAPADTLYGDPQLSSLSYNGGLTPTHALPPSSIAINAGNNLAGAAADQRGTGYARVIGANADVGAFELDLDDVIFADSFD